MVRGVGVASALAKRASSAASAKSQMNERWEVSPWRKGMTCIYSAHHNVTTFNRRRRRRHRLWSVKAMSEIE
jgi:hypothetical protein